MKKNLATIALTLVFLFAVVFLAFHLHQTNRVKILSQFNERQLQAVRQVTQQIESYLKGLSQDALWLSSFASLQGRTAKRMAPEVLEYFNRLKYLHVTEISVIDDKGTVVFSTTAGAVGLSQASSDLLEWAGKTGNRKSVRLITARKSQRSAPGTDESSVPFHPAVFLVTPLSRESAAGDRKPNGKFAGILSLTIDLERMLDEQTLLLLPATKSHPVWIMDTKGTLLLQSEHPEMIMRNLRERDETCNRCHVSFDYVEKILTAAQGTAEYQLRGGIRKIAAFAKMSFGTSSWVVVLNAPYDEVTGFTEGNFKETLLMIGIVVLALSVSSFAMYRNYRQKVIAQEEAKHLLEKQTLMENLRETRDYLENLLDNANAPIVVWDPQFRITRFNRAFERLTGRAANEVLGFPPDVLFPADRREEAMGHVHRTIEGERWETLEIPILHVDGSVRTILWNSATLYSKDGKAVVATIAQGQDITERERAVDQILWNYHTQQALTSILQISLERLSLKEKLEWALDVLFHVPWLRIESKGCIFLVGKELETLAMEAHRGLPPEMLSACGSIRFGKCLCGKAASTRKILFAGGGDEAHTYFPDESHNHGHYCVPILSGDNLLGVLNLYVKAGHQENRQETAFLRATSRVLAGFIELDRAGEDLHRLATAVEQAGEIIMVTDTMGEIQYVNPAFERVTGYPCVEAIGKNPRILKSGEQDEAFYKEMWATLGRGEVWFGKLTNRRKDGTLYDQEAVISPVRDGSGKVVNYVGVLRDTTRERRLEEQLRQSQKMEAIGTLAGGVAHDFNNLLTAIEGYGDLLLLRLGEGNPLAAEVREIQKAAGRASALTRQLLAFSRIQVFQPKVTDLNVIVTNMRKMLTRLIGENIELVTVAGADLGRVKVDASQIEQVLLNLVVNSRDAMPDGGRITVETSNVNLEEGFAGKQAAFRPGPYVMMTVTDTGTGMDQKTMSRIFDPFFTTKETGKGTGLGLATVYGIVKQSNGQIGVCSEPGRGTTFRIHLPRVYEELAEETKEPAVPVRVTGTETVLVVDDIDMVRNLANEVLVNYGYTVLEASDGEDALLLCRRHKEPIHLLLTDVVMPGMSGTKLAKAVSSMLPGTKVLYMSGYSEYGSVENSGLPAGAFFIQKPFSMVGLARKVREVLES